MPRPIVSIRQFDDPVLHWLLDQLQRHPFLWCKCILERLYEYSLKIDS